MPRFGGVVFDVTAQANDEVVDGPRIGIFVQTPNLFEHRFAGDRLSFVLYQVPEDVHLH